MLATNTKDNIFFGAETHQKKKYFLFVRNNNMFSSHDLDPYETNEKNLLAERLVPILSPLVCRYTSAVLLACGTAYFEKVLFSKLQWMPREVYIVEDPHVFRLEKNRREAICGSFRDMGCAQAEWVDGTKKDLLGLLGRLKPETTLCIGLNVTIFEPFHLFDDVLVAFPGMDYILFSWPYMGKFGMPFHSCSNLRGVPFPGQMPSEAFFVASGMMDEYLFASGL